MDEKNSNMDIHHRLPPGFRFHPSDKELIIHYLRKKASNSPLPPASIVTDIQLYKHNPWDLPKISRRFGEEEWYFFTLRDRKYPNGTRPNRMAASGYWKATGMDKPIFLNNSGSDDVVIGLKKSLVFYTGRPPKGNKTDWFMQEYRLPEIQAPWPPKRIESMRLDDWVLCRVWQKSNTTIRKSDQNKEFYAEQEDSKRQRIHSNEPFLPGLITNNTDIMGRDFFCKKYPQLPCPFSPPPHPLIIQENRYPNSIDYVSFGLSYEQEEEEHNKITRSTASQGNIINLDFSTNLVDNSWKRKQVAIEMENGNRDKKVSNHNLGSISPDQTATAGTIRNPINLCFEQEYLNLNVEKTRNYNDGEMGLNMYQEFYGLAFT